MYGKKIPCIERSIHGRLLALLVRNFDGVNAKYPYMVQKLQ